MSQLQRLERLLTNYEAGRDDGVGERAINARARLVARHWIIDPKAARHLSGARKELLDEALQTAMLSWDAQL